MILLFQHCLLVERVDYQVPLDIQPLDHWTISFLLLTGIGAFSIHKYPALMAHLASHKIPIELAYYIFLMFFFYSIYSFFQLLLPVFCQHLDHIFRNTRPFKELTNEIKAYTNPITLLLDNSVPLNLCSYRSFTR